MVTKTRRTLTIVLFLALVSLLTVLLFVQPINAKASAAQSEQRLLYFSYEYKYEVEELEGYDSSASKRNTDFAEQLLCGEESRQSVIYFQALTTSYWCDKDESIWVNSIGTNTINLKASCNFNIGNFEIKNNAGETVAKSAANTCIVTLKDGNYTVTYSAISRWQENIEGTERICSATVKCTFPLTVDTTPPVIKSSLGEFDVVAEEGFTVTAHDELTTAHLYYKTPSMTDFALSTTDMYSVSANSTNGVYEFYAEDPLGNKTEIYSITLVTKLPTSTLIKSDTDNSVRLIWDNASWTATIDGNEYINGAWVTDEGAHTFILSDKYGHTTIYEFTIDHYYVREDSVEATCDNEGYIKYKCKHCQDVQEEILPKTKHKFLSTIVPSSCTESGATIYTCEICNYEYVVNDSLPKGHEFTSNIIKGASCTEEGTRISQCDICGYSYETTIPAQGHDYEISSVKKVNGNTIRTYKCSTCGNTYTQELGNQYEQVSNYVEYLYKQYQPYMIWVFLATAGVWSIAIGVALIIAHKNEDKEKAKKMLVNYAVGLVIIFVILIACPLLVRGIAALVT
ncbi:MAG: hypothetical protein J1F65_00110 [Clostridiales bacterium]|nr:hypothetical protein [Clostridiales bacterium]